MGIESRIHYKLRNINGLEDVQTALERLTHDLQGDALERVISFNNTYLIITRKVKNEITRGSFSCPDFLTKFDTIFAHYYFSALSGYLKNKNVAAAWKCAFDSGIQGYLSHFIIMALGVNAHVNNDISQVLADCHANERHYKDYKLINTIIASSLNEVIDSLAEDKTLYGPKNLILTPMYRLIMRVMIIYWRRKAWHDYLRLKAEKIQIVDIERSAHSTAKLLARIPI